MGYFIKNIAKESKSPARVSLSGNPNFIEFAGIKDREDRPVDVEWRVVGNGFVPDETKPGEYKNITDFTILESDMVTEHTFRGTTNEKEVGNNVFYLGPPDMNGLPVWTNEQIANSLRNCLVRNSFFRSNFEVNVVFGNDSIDRLPLQSDIVRVISKGAGQKYTFSFKATDKDFKTAFLTFDNGAITSDIGDTLGQGYNIVDVNIDVYKNTGVFLGEDDIPAGTLGEYVTTLAKSYSYTPLWFDLNAMNRSVYSNAFLTADGWCDAGTGGSFRFTASRVINSSGKYDDEVFYYSDVLYTLTGYNRTLEPNNLSDYIYHALQGNIIKPLTRQPVLHHIKGQSQYFNFILSDPAHNRDVEEEHEIGILFRLYSQSKKYLDSRTGHMQHRRLFGMVNTVRLDIDGVIEEYEAAGNARVGIVEVYLYSNGAEKSDPLVFKILPACLYEVHDFAFLNPLGGWSSFNFSGIRQTDFKATGSTIFKTQLSDYTISSQIESVYSKEVNEQFVVQTMPIGRTVADWLKEMSASPAVYELSTGRYVIVDEMNIKHNSTDDLFRVEMKYHYSDTYNARLK